VDSDRDSADDRDMLMLLVRGAAAATLTVGPSGTWPTINEAEAAAVDGDVIEIGAGVYFESLNPGGKALTYLSTAGAVVSAYSPCMTIANGEVVEISGLTFEGCGVAVQVSGGSSVSISDTTFRDNACDSGCAVAASDLSDILLTGATFSGNAASSLGGSVYATDGVTVVIENSTFTGGSAGSGGYVAVEAGSGLSISGSTFRSGTATSYGGAIYASSSSLSLSEVTVTGSSADYGGAIWTDDASLSASTATFSGNTAASQGGAVYTVAGALSLYDVAITGNVAGGSGGGMLQDGSGDGLSLQFVTFAENTSGGNGGGAYLSTSGPVDVSVARFIDNHADSTGGGLRIASASAVGVYAAAFAGNSADTAGGGAINGDALDLSGLAFIENQASSYGGLVLSGGASSAWMRNVSFACNSGGDPAGARLVTDGTLYVQGLLAVENDSGGVAGSNYVPTSSLVYGNTSYDWGDSSWLSYADNQNTDPMVRFLSCDGDWTSDDVAPSTGSPLIDMGTSTDDDGSTGDIGAYGGEWGALLDVDGDGWTYWDGDCHDGRADAFPGASEVWYDGIDQDCDGRDDDRDGDGFVAADDCNDTDDAVNPAEAEVWYDGTDQDCDGNDQDQDYDGFDLADDCDDTASGVNPGQAEVWYDGTDQDCDGNDQDQDYDGVEVSTDCDDLDPTINPDEAEVWYDSIDQDCDGNDEDQDHDGFAYTDECDDLNPDINPGEAEIWYDGVDQDCDGNDLDRDGDGYAGDGTDCDDTNPDVNPGVAEIWYDGLDQDCDGNDADRDGDGYAGGTGPDCDDTDAAIHPGADDPWYDGIDQNCDGDDDDQDKDGYGLFDANPDCNDENAAVHPGAEEAWYDGVDQDCDDADDYDQDRDGHASVAWGDDCDDTNPTIHPGVDELWYDGIDQDCDGNDEDQDGDGFVVTEDCVDTDIAIRPDAEEVWYDGVDQNCDGNDDDQDADGRVVAEDCDDTDATITRCIQHIDGGCDSSGASPAWLLALTALLLITRRASPFLLAASPALALDATGTGPAPTDAGGLLRAGGMSAGPAGNLDIGLTGGFTGHTAEATWDDGTETTLMSGVATAELGIGWTFLDGLRIEGGLPVVITALEPKALGPGLADAWLGAQWAPLRMDAISLGPSVRVTLPTGAPARLSGGGGVGGALLVAAGGTAGPVRWGAEIGPGVRAYGAYDRFSFAYEPELRGGGGARVTLIGPITAGAEVLGHVGFGSANAVTLSTSGAEALVTAGVALERVDIGLAGGVGLVDGVGTPDWRALVSVRGRVVQTGPRPDDSDADGIADTRDPCASQPEDKDGFEDDDGCPDADNDADGVLDAADACPVDPEDKDQVSDEDGCPDADDDGDGLKDGFDRCPRDAGPAETNGCPDRDYDGVLDSADACPDEAALPGTDLTHSDGCPTRVAVFLDRLHLRDRVDFDARGAIVPASNPVIADIAAVLKKYPDLARIEIGVHVDASDDDAQSLALTQARAEAVRRALIAAGVAEARLVAQGYGAVRPIAPNDTDENRAKNRRVELRILR
jgi:predicted outer membrane repeat protein